MMLSFTLEYTSSKKVAPAFPYSDNGEGFFYIFSLANHFEPTDQWSHKLDIGIATPTEKILEEKIRMNSQVLLKFGKAILTGAKWFDDRGNQIVDDKIV